MTSLSIIIVTYRCKDEALGCLHTLYAEGGLDGLDAEVFVVDNASGDGVIAAIQEQYPQVIAQDLPGNVGFSAGNNVALKQATGRNILFLNPDTLIPHGALKQCVDFLESQPDSVGGMTCRVVTATGETQWECARRLTTPWTECVRALWPFSPPEALPPATLERTGPVPCLLGAFMLFRSSTLEKIGGFDERFFLMYEDIDLCQRAKDAGFSLVYWPEMRITHLGGSSWKKEKVETYVNSHASALKYIQKHFPHSAWWVRAIVRLGMELRILALRLRRRSEWSAEHLAMAQAAREALKSS
ncbi:MAG: glycosyltransferase family 2 protein [Armatimonas sp.]